MFSSGRSGSRLSYLDHLEDVLVDPEGTPGWPKTALSMINQPRMHQLREAVETVLAENVPGHLIETGVWRGGACFMMRAVLWENQVEYRKVYVADSFCGLPEPEERCPADAGDAHHTWKDLAISLDEVKSCFALNDPQVVFVEGWFKDTLPKLNGPFALIRLDGDMYSSTMDALNGLFDKVSVGGFVIIDDYWAVSGCQQAVNDFRAKRGIHTPMTTVRCAAYWRKE